MSESSTEGTVETDTSARGSDSAEETQADTTDWKAEARKWEQRAKENTTAAKAAEKARLAAMSESERAVAEAESRGRTAAAVEFGKELAQTQFDAAAGRRNAEFDTAKVLRRLDLSTLLDENGRPDAKAIQDAVADLVPAANAGPPSLDGGARTTANTADFNQVLRRAAGRA